MSSVQNSLESGEEEDEMDEHLDQYSELKGEDYEEFDHVDQSSFEASDIHYPSEAEDEQGSLQESYEHEHSSARATTDSEETKYMNHLNQLLNLQELIDALPPDIGEPLQEFWMEMERNYAMTNLECLEGIERCHQDLLEYSDRFRKEYLELLEGPDYRMKIITSTKSDFNRVRYSTRNDERFKALLQKRITELILQLEGVTEQKYSRAKADAYKLLTKEFLSVESEKMAALFGSLLQAQTNRFVDTVKFINDHYFNIIAFGLNVPNQVAWKTLADISLLDEGLLAKYLEELEKCHSNRDPQHVHCLPGIWRDDGVLRFIKGDGDKTHSSSSTSCSDVCICEDDQGAAVVCECDDKNENADEYDSKCRLLDDGEYAGEGDQEMLKHHCKMRGEMKQSFRFDTEEFYGEGETDAWLTTAQTGETESVSEGPEEETEHVHMTSDQQEKEGMKRNSHPRNTDPSKVDGGTKDAKKDATHRKSRQIQDTGRGDKNGAKGKNGKTGNDQQQQRQRKSIGFAEREGEVEEEEHGDEEEGSEETLSSHLEGAEEGNETELDLEDSCRESLMSRQREGLYAEFGGEDNWDPCGHRGEGSWRGSKASSVKGRGTLNFDENDYLIDDLYWDSESSKQGLSGSDGQGKGEGHLSLEMGSENYPYEDEEYYDEEDVFYLQADFFEKDNLKGRGKSGLPGNGCPVENPNLHYFIFGEDKREDQEQTLIQKLLNRHLATNNINSKGEDMLEEEDWLQNEESIENRSGIRAPTPSMESATNNLPSLSATEPQTVHTDASLKEQDEPSQNLNMNGVPATEPKMEVSVDNFPVGYKRPLIAGLETQQDEIWHGFVGTFKEAKVNIAKVQKAVKDAISQGYPLERKKKMQSKSLAVSFQLMDGEDSDFNYGPPLTDSSELANDDVMDLFELGQKLISDGMQPTPEGDEYDEDLDFTKSANDTAQGTGLENKAPPVKKDPSLDLLSASNRANSEQGQDLMYYEWRAKLLQRTPARLDLLDPFQGEDAEMLKRKRKLAEILSEDDLPHVREIKSKLKTKLQNWEKALELEVERLQRYIAAIDARANEELRLFKELPLQVWEAAKVNASHIYIDDLKRDAEIGEVFRSAVDSSSLLYGDFWINRWDLMLKLSGKEPPIPLDYPEELLIRTAERNTWSSLDDFEE